MIIAYTRPAKTKATALGERNRAPVGSPAGAFSCPKGRPNDRPKRRNLEQLRRRGRPPDRHSPGHHLQGWRSCWPRTP
jgi:hypothetical protein